jgi:hypothetical protein
MKSVPQRVFFYVALTEKPFAFWIYDRRWINKLCQPICTLTAKAINAVSDTALRDKGNGVATAPCP